MSLCVTALASGSSGNALLVQTASTSLLIDCGLPLRALERHLRCRGIEPSALRAVVLTHEHGDHAQSAAAFARRYSVPVVCNQPTYDALAGELADLPHEIMPVGGSGQLGDLEISSFLLPHDAAAPVGYRLNAAGVTVGIAIDLGSWNEAVVAGLAEADLLIIEANHDREQLLAGPYPWAVQQRICGPLGHLDNSQAGELIARLCRMRTVDHVWLAHLSANSNSPKTAIAGVQRVLKLLCTPLPALRALPRRSPLALQGAPTWRSDERLVVQGRMF